MSNPEIGSQYEANDITTNYHDLGSGDPVLLLHGSGPGVSAWANWRLVFARMENTFRLIAPDLVGFGYTDFPEEQTFSREVWLRQIVDLLDHLQIEKINVIGNSFGGSMALALAIHHPDRVNRLLLMGSVGVYFTLTEGLDDVWGYTPSFENMQAIMKIFAYDENLISADIVNSRYQASLRDKTRAAYERMFPAPRQRWVEAMAFSDEQIQSIQHQTLLIHGRDDKVIPVETSLKMLSLIDKSQLHLISRCGHWTQIEHNKTFVNLATQFFNGEFNNE